MRIMLILLLSCLPIALLAQDMLVLKNGQRINGKITSEDSAQVVLYYYQNSKKITMSYNKAEVEQVLRSSSTIKKNYISKSQMGFSIGLSVPQGIYANDEWPDPEAGLAGYGFSANLVYTNYFKPTLGFTARLFYNSNLTKWEDIFRTYNDIPKTDIKFNNISNNMVYGVLLGFTKYKQVKNFTVTGSVLAGFGNYHKPYFSDSRLDSTANYSRKILTIEMDRSVGDGGFFYSLGTGLEYQLNDNCKLTANVEYLYGIISFHTLRHITQYNSTLGVTHQTFKAINATIGLSFLLRRK